jgi:DNA-binding CsgD family transcriptional regulator
MPGVMMQRRVEIICQIGAGKSTNWIAENLRHSPKLIQEFEIHSRRSH